MPKAATKKAKKSLVIVESPAKARTVGRFLGDDYIVKASMGHVRDLPERQIGVELEGSFEPTYVQVRGRNTVVADIKKAAKGADTIYLATDPDREGEAISWHLVEAADLDKNDNLKRVVFHEITKDAIEEAFSHPREIDMQLVNAQQARRILDRIVGYRLSPVLWSKVRRGLSAGRVQSVALRLIVDREREIEAFKPEEYWVISVDMEIDASGKKQKFNAGLYRVHDQKGRPKVENGEQASAIVKDLDSASYKVGKVNRREVKQRPRAPFTTSTLQQQSARSLRYNAQRTMRIAQQLYEGIQLGDGDPTGLITYMRTDSTNIAQAALDEANGFIKSTYGSEYADKPRVYRTRSRNAQEAHEAIRPTSIANTPEKVAPFLEQEQLRLYEMIWKRMVASQMADAIVDQTTVDIEAAGPDGRTHTVRASGSIIKFPGFRTLYIEEKDEDDESEESRELPDMNEGDTPDKLKVNSEQKFTQPPPRYTEANLIRSLEELGIGRPSTYASIVSTIEQRQYVERVASRFKPTLIGTVVADLLKEHFPNIMDTGFTADMEGKLDAIAEGDLEWVPMLAEFYKPFSERVDTTMENAPRVDRAKLVEKSDETCDGGEDMVVRVGRYGKFLSCSNFPNCRVAYPLKPGENAKGDAIEAWTAQRTDQMAKCWKLHPEEAARIAAEADARPRRSRKDKEADKAKGRRPFRRRNAS